MILGATAAVPHNKSVMAVVAQHTCDIVRLLVFRNSRWISAKHEQPVSLVVRPEFSFIFTENGAQKNTRRAAGWKLAATLHPGQQFKKKKKKGSTIRGELRQFRKW